MISQACYVTRILCILLFISNTTVSHSFSNAKKLEKNETRINHCKSWQFRCNSGQCIAKPFVCDGLKDCNDNSDENYDQCRNNTSIKCKEEQFQCQYGACIEKKYLCDGQKHCIDESDESSDTCNVLRDQLNKKRNKRFVEKACTALTSSPHKTVNYHCSNNPSWGTCGPINGYVPHLIIATVTCAPGYYLNNLEIGSTHTSCFNSQWSPPVGECVKKCDQLNPVNIVLECHYNGLKMGYCDGSSVLLTGTQVRPTCEPAYKYDYPPSYHKITCDGDGKWDNNLLPCVPECGKPYHANAQLAITGGTPESIGGSPWHVAIFNKDQKFICGGTIISESVVLSAAHCFGDDNRCQGTNCIEDFEVFVGKYTSNYTVKDNSHQKIMKIKEIRYSTIGYRGLSTYHAADVVALILEEKIPISPAILPACMNWDALRKKKYPPEGEPGKVVGWGLTENDTISTVLRNISLPFIGHQRCVDMVDEDFKPYVTIDKFCAGTGNHTGPIVLQGDSGGGLLFQEKEQFYLQGVVSVKEVLSNAVSVFTDLSHYVDWIASIRDEAEKKAPKKRIQSPSGEHLPAISSAYDADNVTERLAKEIVRDMQSNNFSSAQSKLQQGTDDTYRYVVWKVYSEPIDNFELLLHFADHVDDYEQRFKLYDNIRNEIRNSNSQHTASQLQKLRKLVKKEIVERAQGDLPMLNLYNALQEEIHAASVALITATFQNDTSWRIARQVSADMHENCYSCLVDIYKEVVDNVWNKVDIPYLLKKVEYKFTYIAEDMALHTAIFNKLQQTGRLTTSLAAILVSAMKSNIHSSTYEGVNQDERNKYEILYNTARMTIQKSAVGPISAAFQNDTSWPTARRMSADIYNDCPECLVSIYYEMVETVWNKVSIQELLEKGQNELKYSREKMALHKVVFDKLQQTGTSTTSLTAKLASLIKAEMNMSNYEKVGQVERTNYEELFSTVKMTMRERAVAPISAAFQNDTLWPIAQQMSANVQENCHECVVDIYNEVVDNVWNKVAIRDILRKARNNLKSYGEAVAVHKAIINKIKRTDTLNASSTTLLTSFMKESMESAVRLIAAAFQNDTSWPIAQQLSANIHENCHKCVVDIYNKVLDNVWNKVTIQDILRKARNNLKSYGEAVAVRKAIISKLKPTDTLNTSSTALLRSFMQETTDAAAGLISAAFYNDTSWPAARRVSADIYNNCKECLVGIYKVAVETIWNNVTLQELLEKAQNELSYIREVMAFHTAIFNKLQQTGTSTTGLLANLASCIKDQMNLTNYKDVGQVERTNYEKLFTTVKKTIREAAVGPIAAAFQNDTLWPAAQQFSANIHENCHKCVVDIYNEVIDKVWNKVTIEDVLRKARNLKNFGEAIAVHKAIINKLKPTDTLNTSSTALLKSFMKETTDAAAALISAAFYNDTSWSAARRVSADIFDNCIECMVDIYKEVVETVWNKVTIEELLEIGRNELEYIREVMAFHTVIFNKLQQTGTSTTGLLANLASCIKDQMNVSNYKGIVQDERTKYEALYKNVKMIIQKAAVGPISAAFQNDTSWPIVRQLSANITDNCFECLVDIYNEVVDNVWNKVNIQNLLGKVRNELDYILEDMALDTAVFHKLQLTGTLNTGMAAKLAFTMMTTMNEPNYKKIDKDKRTDYEALYNTLLRWKPTVK